MLATAALGACSRDAPVGPERLRAGLAEGARANVLLISLDTTRADRIGCYGAADAITPHVDALARQGVRFAQAVAPAPMTLPTHASLFTASHPSAHGVRDNGRARAAKSLTTLAEVLAREGYATGAFVASVVLDGRFGLDQGFATYDDELPAAAGPSDGHGPGHERPAREVVDRAEAWLRDTAPGQRFFCWVHLFDPHSPHRAPPPWDTRLPGRAYDGEIAACDEQVGRLLATLAELGVEERTLVVLVADHGEAFGEHGEQGHAVLVYDTTLLVPLVMAWPGTLPAGTLVERQVSLVDVAPTVLDALGHDIPTDWRGRSLLDACFDPESLDERPVLAESMHGALRFGWAPLAALRTGRWKYIRAPRPELYDLHTDPLEERNLVDEHPETARELDLALDELLASHAADGVVTEQPALDAELAEALDALGYAGGETLDAGRAAGADPKDRIAALVAYQQAKELLGAGRQAEAIVLLDGLVAESPDSSELHGQLGLAHARLQQWPEAETHLSRALALHPEHRETLGNLAAVHMATGDHARARPLLERALRLDADDAMAHLNLGALDLREGRVDEGLAHHERFLELAPDDPRADAVRRSVQALRDG